MHIQLVSYYLIIVNHHKIYIPVIFLAGKMTNIGDKVTGRYDIFSDIGNGKGAMGHTYLARDTMSRNNIVCVKEVRTDNCNPQEKLDRITLFDTETRCLRKISQAGGHPNIVRIYDSFNYNGTSFLVMENLPGADLDTLMEQTVTRLSTETITTYMNQILDAMEFYHSLDIIHRDLNPRNVRVVPNCNSHASGKIYTIDFGIAIEIMSTGPVDNIPGRGSQGYFGPEAFGNPLKQSDIYSAGALLFNMLTAQAPVDITTEKSALRTQVKLAVNFKNLSPEWAEIILMATNLSPADRYLTPASMKKAIADIAVNTSVSAAYTSQQSQTPVGQAQQTNIYSLPSQPQPLPQIITATPPSNPAPSQQQTNIRNIDRFKRGMNYVMGVAVAAAIYFGALVYRPETELSLSFIPSDKSLYHVLQREDSCSGIDADDSDLCKRVKKIQARYGTQYFDSLSLRPHSRNETVPNEVSFEGDDGYIRTTERIRSYAELPRQIKISAWDNTFNHLTDKLDPNHNRIIGK